MWEAIKGLGSSLGDFIGLDGKFGGFNGVGQNFSLANLGDAFSDVLGIGGNVMSQQDALNAGYMGNVADLAINNPTTTSLAGGNLIGNMGLKDLLSTGIAGYNAMNQADLAKNQISLANQAYADQKALSDRNVKKQDEYDQRIADAWTASLAKGQ